MGKIIKIKEPPSRAGTPQDYDTFVRDTNIGGTVVGDYGVWFNVYNYYSGCNPDLKNIGNTLRITWGDVDGYPDGVEVEFSREECLRLAETFLRVGMDYRSWRGV